MKLGFIGTGHMGGALARAASQNSSNTLLLANRHPEKAQKLAEIIGGNPCDNLQAASEADYLFLGVKPQMLEGMLIGIEDTLKARTTLARLMGTESYKDLGIYDPEKSHEEMLALAKLFSIQE